MKDDQLQCTPPQLRHMLMQAAAAVATGNLTPKQATAIAKLTEEIHKSIKLEYVEQLMCDRDNVCVEDVVRSIGHAK